jgi:hypothetical protein
MSLNWSLSEGHNSFVSNDPHAARCRFHHAQSNAMDDSALVNDIDAALDYIELVPTYYQTGRERARDWNKA